MCMLDGSIAKQERTVMEMECEQRAASAKPSVPPEGSISPSIPHG